MSLPEVLLFQASSWFKGRGLHAWVGAVFAG